MADINFTRDGSTGLSPAPASTQQYVISKAGLQALAAATYTYAVGPTDAQGADWQSGSGPKHIRLYKGDGSSTIIGVGSDIVFPGEIVNGVEQPLTPLIKDPITNQYSEQPTGTFRVDIDGNRYEIPIKGLAGDAGEISLGGTTTVDGHLLPSKDADTANDEWNIGSIDDFDTSTSGVQPRRWNNLYLRGNIGSSAYPINTLYATNINSSGPLGITSTADGITGSSNNGNTLPSGTITGNTNASIHTSGGIYAAQNIYGLRVFNAVFNDYAEFRTTVDLIPGCVVIDQDDGSLVCSSARLQPGAQVISDTYGHCMGATATAQTPVAVAGRVLVYPYQNRNNYHAGMAVCSAPGGTVDIMTREEIRNYPDCIIGIVSEIPEYEEWGSDNVKVNGRIWIRVK